MANSITIPKSIIQNNTEEKNKLLIIQSVLNAMGAQEKNPVLDQVQIKIFQEPVFGNQNGLILFLRFDPKNTIAAVYREKGDQYEFVSILGRFYEIKNVSFQKEKKSGRTILLLEEFTNMQLGAYEKNTFLRGYLWNGMAFGMVLNLCIHIEAYWNNAWISSEKKKRWEKLFLDSKYQWGEEENLTLYQYETQEYSVSSDTENKSLPKADTFQIIRDRFLVETIIWSEKWNQFILYESILKKIGEPVAVLQDIINSPYSLVEGEIEKCVVYTEKKETLVVSQEELKPGC